MRALAELTVTHPFIAIPSAIAAGLVAYGIIWKRALVPFGHFIRNVNELTVTAKDLIEATPVLVDIAHEFHPNNGSTLRDSIDRIEGNLAVAVSKVTEWANERDGVLHRLASLEALVEHYHPRPADPTDPTDPTTD